MKAKSEAERAKAYRERQKLRAAGLLVEPAPLPPLTYPKQALSDYLGEELDRLESVDWVRQEIGLDLDYLFAHERSEEAKASELMRTHALVASLMTSLETLCSTLSEYEIAQIDREIDRLKSSDLADPAAKEHAFEMIVRLTDQRRKLTKKSRLSLAEFEVEGKGD